MANYYDRGFRNHDVRRPSGDDEPAGYRSHGSPDGDYDRGCRNDFRSSAAYGGADGRLEIVRGNVFSANQDYAASAPPRYPPPARRPSCGGGCSSAWCFSDPETKRRRRVAAYKAYTVEGKLKASIRKGFRWIKDKCFRLAHGL